jgi:MFS family permease
MLGTLVAWWVYEISKNPLDLGLIGLAEIIPFVGILLLGGAWSDQYNRKWLMISSILAYLLIVFLMCCLSAWQILFENENLLKLVYALIFLTGLARGLLSPSQNALLGQLVSKEKVAMASVWNSIVFHIGSVGGPALGGMVYTYFGIQNSLLGVLLLIATSLVFLFLLPRIQNPAPLSHAEKLSGRILTGIRFVKNHKILLPAMTMDMVAVLFGGLVAILPLFADQVLQVGAQGLGWLRAAPAIGSLAIAMVISRFPLGQNAGKLLLICVFGFGMTNLAFAFSKDFLLSFALLVLGGAFDNVSAIIRMSVVQIYTPDDMKGRVSAVNAIFIGSSNELGAFESGLAARWLGLIPSVVFGAGITFLTVGFTVLKAKTLRNLNMKV